MGPSGSGKTTLLTILALRNEASFGSIALNGTPANPDARRLMGFVSQLDLLFPTLTVWETVLFHAQLRLPVSVSLQEKKAIVGEILRKLRLEHIKDNRVGKLGTTGGLSGGERKRVNIACELVHRPPILLLDEPTSGLDATASLEILQILRELTLLGHTVICTIHQPRSALYDLFDRFIFLCDGRTFYFGRREEAISDFAREGFVCPDKANPLDFFIDVLSATRDKGEQFTISSLKDVQKSTDALASQVSSKTVVLDKGYATGFFRQLVVLSSRAFKHEFREPLTSFVSLFQSIFMAAIVALLYSNTSLEEPEAIANRSGAIFFIFINAAFSTASSIKVLIEEMEVVAHEQSSRVYRIPAYYFSKLMSELPMRILSPLIFSCVCYFAIGFQKSFSHWMVFTLLLFLLSYTAASLAVMVGSVLAKPDAANVIVPVSYALLLLFGGSSFISINSIPIFLRWIRTISFFNYAIVGAVINEFSGLVFSCPNDQIEVPCASGTGICQVCRVPTGEVQIKLMGLHKESIGTSVLALVLMIVVLRVIAAAALFWRHRTVNVSKSKVLPDSDLHSMPQEDA